MVSTCFHISSRSKVILYAYRQRPNKKKKGQKHIKTEYIEDLVLNLQGKTIRLRLLSIGQTRQIVLTFVRKATYMYAHAQTHRKGKLTKSLP